MFDEDDSSEEEETEEIPALTNGKKRKATSEDESTAPAKKKSNKEEKKQAIEMAKKIGHFDGLKLANSIAADTIKVSLGLSSKPWCVFMSFCPV